MMFTMMLHGAAIVPNKRLGNRNEPDEISIIMHSGRFTK